MGVPTSGSSSVVEKPKDGKGRNVIIQMNYHNMNSQEQSSTARNNKNRAKEGCQTMKVMNITQDPADMKKVSASVCLQQLSPTRIAGECPQTTKALHETAIRPARHFLQSSASQPSILLSHKNPINNCNNVNKSMAVGNVKEPTTNNCNNQSTNNCAVVTSQSVERAKSNLNAGSAFIEAYLVRKPAKLTNKLINESSIAGGGGGSGEWSSSHQDGKSSVKMIKKGNTFFPAIFKSPTGTGSNK